MPVVSIITPLYRPVRAHLRETIRGVAEQKLPDGCGVEWLVQEDGLDRTVDPELLDVPGLAYQANGEHLGVAATRNIALSRATGPLVQVLDQDDYLLPDALATLVPHFDNPATHWAIAQADDLHEDGTHTSWDSRLPYGVIPAGAANDDAIAHAGNWAVHCAGLMIRTEVLRALGGWVANHGDDDIVMFASLSEIAQGYNDPTVTWLYRQHPGQLHRTEASQRRSAAGRQVALQRVTAMRTAQLAATTGPLRTSSQASLAGAAEKD